VQTDITTSACAVMLRIHPSIFGDFPDCAPTTTMRGGGASSKV